MRDALPWGASRSNEKGRAALTPPRPWPLEPVEDQREYDDNGERNADQPQQKTLTHPILLLHF
ncbi:MAG: hypothetical protein JWO65_546 [Sphingomonas bacterium]|nr:hypothetical protein [Sphingomonas bacterium]